MEQLKENLVAPTVNLPPSVKTIPWGNATQIRYLTRQFTEKEIAQAAQAIPAEFKPPEDFFVGLNRQGSLIIATIPHKPTKLMRFFFEYDYKTEGGLTGAVKNVLEQAAKFLKPPV